MNKNWWQILRETKLANDCTTCILQRCAFYTWYYFDLVFFCLHACSEHEILREEIKSLQAVRSKLQQKIQDLEDELKKVKEDAEQSKATKVCMNLEHFFSNKRTVKMPISANWSIKTTSLVYSSSLFSHFSVKLYSGDGQWCCFSMGSFNNYVDKIRWVGGLKISIFVHVQGRNVHIPYFLK